VNGLGVALRGRASRASVGGTLEASREYAIVIIFFALFLTLTFSASHFLTRVNLVNNLESGAIYGMVACALTMLLIVGEFDLSVGATFVLAGIVAAKLQSSLGTWPALLVGIAPAVAVGLVNGIAVAYFRVNSFIATLATSLMVVGVGTKVTNGAQLFIAAPSFGELGNSKAFGIGAGVGIDWFILIFIAFALACGFVLARSKLGRWLYATGGNPEAARLSGINVRSVKIGAFAFSGFAAGVAGVVFVSRTTTAIAGNGIEDVVFPAFAAVVVGGTSVQGGRGAIWRTVFGILFLECIRNGFNLLEVNTFWQPVIQGGIILVAVAIDSLSRRA
jgi:ribose transport system permease protein